MAKYDGFTLKNCLSRTPWIIPGYFHQSRNGVIKDFEKTTGRSWRIDRRKGTFKIVKVKLVEVA
jgi:hypothetical protein